MYIEGNLAILAPLGIMVLQRGEEQQQALNKKRELSLDYHSSIVEDAGYEEKIHGTTFVCNTV